MKDVLEVVEEVDEIARRLKSNSRELYGFVAFHFYGELTVDEINELVSKLSLDFTALREFVGNTLDR